MVTLKSTIRRIFPALFALYACADKEDNLSFSILAHMRGSDGQCVYDVSGIRILSPGYLDVGGLPQAGIGGRSNYTLYPMFENRIISRPSTAPIRPDTSTVTIKGAIVSILNAQRQQDFGPVLMPGAATVPGMLGTQPGRIVGSLDILPADYATRLKQQVSGDQQVQIYFLIQAVGQTDGDTEIKTSVFEWPVKVCSGCLWRCAVSGESEKRACAGGQDDISIIKCP